MVSLRHSEPHALCTRVLAAVEPSPPGVTGLTSILSDPEQAWRDSDCPWGCGGGACSACTLVPTTGSGPPVCDPILTLPPPVEPCTDDGCPSPQGTVGPARGGGREGEACSPRLPEGRLLPAAQSKGTRILHECVPRANLGHHPDRAQNTEGTFPKRGEPSHVPG